MPKLTIPYKETGYFSKLMCDYLDQDDALSQFYGKFPQLDNFEAQLTEKAATFSADFRTTLVRQLNAQYANCPISEATQLNIEALAESNTFTITTGHQLNLFTGPLYFLYKIFSVINLSEQLNTKHAKYHFVPIYWMATEDHDFDEINYFNFKDQKQVWDRTSGGAVGELTTEGLAEISEQLKTAFGDSEHGRKLSELFTKAYAEHDTFAAATRYLGNELFKEYGLVIVDGNDAILKKAFIPFAEKELFENRGFQKVTETTERLVAAGYSEQVYPREINLFYLGEGVRERIVEASEGFVVNETKLSFSKEEILQELKMHPERFSPNALLRPLYQEVTLPNLCYVGGGGELAYWFQLQDYFKSVSIPFPILLLRNSALLVPSQLSEKLDKLGSPLKSLFKKQHKLQEEHTRGLSEITIDFSNQREQLQQQFKELYELAQKTDASFLGAVGAQEKKQLNGLDHLEKRLLKAQKRKHSDQLNRLVAIQDELFPKQSLQERSVNFSEFYLEYGAQLFSVLKENLDPMESSFTILEL